MHSKTFTRSVMTLALGFGLAGTLAPASLLAAPVGNMATSADNRWSLDIGVERSRREMTQRGDAEAGSDSFSTGGDRLNGGDLSFDETPINGGGTRTISEGFNGLKADEEQTDLFAQLNYAVTPRIELYGRVGATQSRLTNFSSFNPYREDSESFTENGPTRSDRFEHSSISQNDGDYHQSGSTDVGWLAAVGGRFNLHEWNERGVALNLDVMYQIRNAGGGWDTYSPFFFGGENDVVSVDGHKSSEWHAALVLERVVGDFRPYGGLKYARVKSEYDLVRTSEFEELDGSTGKLRLRNQRELGFLGGMEYRMTPAMSILGEIRAGDETALNLGVRYRFN